MLRLQFAAFAELEVWVLRMVERRAETLILFLARGTFEVEDLCFLLPADGLNGLLGGNILFPSAPPFQAGETIGRLKLGVDKASGKLEIFNGVMGRMDFMLSPLVSSHPHTCRV